MSIFIQIQVYYTPIFIYYIKIGIWYIFLTGDNIEKKWKHIKDAYFRSIKENKPKSGDGANKRRKKNYVYHDQLGFLIKTIQPRQTTSSLHIQPQTADKSLIHDSSIELPAQHIELRPNQHQPPRPLQHFYESPYTYYNSPSNASSSYISSSPSPQLVYQPNIIADDQTFTNSPNT